MSTPFKKWKGGGGSGMWRSHTWHHMEPQHAHGDSAPPHQLKTNSKKSTIPWTCVTNRITLQLTHNKCSSPSLSQRCSPSLSLHGTLVWLQSFFQPAMMVTVFFKRKNLLFLRSANAMLPDKEPYLTQKLPFLMRFSWSNESITHSQFGILGFIVCIKCECQKNPEAC